MLYLPTGKTVQLVLTNFMAKGAKISAHHPVHLHGHGFAVLKVQESTKSGFNSPDIACVDDLCNKMVWKNHPVLDFNAPPVKDTVLIPVHGFVVIRFRTDNPGYWFLHCHHQQHLMDGMAMIVQVNAKRETKCGGFYERMITSLPHTNRERREKCNRHTLNGNEEVKERYRAIEL